MFSFKQVSAARCWDLPDFLSDAKKSVDCETKTIKTINPKALTDINLNQVTSMFDIKFNCLANDQVICDKVLKTYNKAGEIISSTLTLNTPITINATFGDLCGPTCGTGGIGPLGAAGPARLIEMEDDDGLIRLYPQALIKQFQLKKAPEFSEFDINAGFNLRANFWFDGDPQILPNQTDLILVVVHEMIHGLGFANSWRYPFSLNSNVRIDFITPIILADESSDKITFEGFQELAFDRYLVFLPSGKPLTSITTELNKFGGGKGAKFSSADEFLNKWFQSEQYELAKSVYVAATTPLGIGFLPRGFSDLNNAIPLETSIKYKVGSSIGHLDSTTFNNTADFLMKYVAIRGVTHQNVSQINGNHSEIIGPATKSILESLGFSSENNLNPYRPKIVESNDASKIIKLVTSLTLTLFSCIIILIL
ncbi:4520_t:CDS:1 [Funneliformis caledonium]|uniref:4520_t:CDS:1 n=1 Tax=Funneliformis caledonium TaxID=1117310 RepID=A0A9N8YQ84_9GLOM|nr:4520_t:CDS:1 [Funneliformis caledonium]